MDGVFLGVPCKLGKDGVEEVIELDLDEEELAALRASGAGVRKLIAELENL